MRPKAFDILDRKQPQYFNNLFLCHDDCLVDIAAFKEEIRQLMEYAFENRDKGIEIEETYRRLANSHPPQGLGIFSVLFLDILKGDDRFIFWRIFMPAAQWHNMKHRNDLDFELIDIVKMYNELNLLDNQVIVYVGEFNKQAADDIINNESLDDTQRISMLGSLLRKSESVFSELDTPLKATFEDYARNWISKIEESHKLVHENRDELVPATQFTPVANKNGILTSKPITEKRLDSRMNKAAIRYGKLFADTARYLVQQGVLEPLGDNYKIVDGSEDLFAYIGQQIHSHTCSRYEEEEKSKVAWCYFRERLCMPGISNPVNQRSLKKIEKGYTPHGASVDIAMKKFAK